MSEEDTPRLEIHVLGATKGESMVVRLPSGQWGVVDCYAPRSTDEAANPTIQLLDSQGVEALEFLCLTHPDEDHYLGMSRLVERYQPRRFWQFAGFTGYQLVQLVAYVQRQTLQRHGPEQAEPANDFLKTLHAINERRKKRLTEVSEMSDYKLLYRATIPHADGEQVPFQIVSLAPSTGNIHEYQQSLSRCFDAQGRPKARLPYLRHNRISAALLLSYGATRVLLGGDVEKENWAEILSKASEWDLQLPAHLVKVSHHGSPTGMLPALWMELGRNRNTYAVITPFTARNLPRREVVEEIGKYAREIFVTSLPGVPYLRDRLFEFLPTYDNRVQEGIRMSSKFLYARRSLNWGRCAFSFDHRGNCSIELAEPAGRLAFAR